MSLRVMVYSHDTFGLGNIRRMLAVSEHLLAEIEGISILLVTGSPVIHEFRLRHGLDYIKLPCLSRTGRDEYSAKTLGTEIGQLIRLRAGLILSAAREFKPDVVLIDKKPDGVKHELRPTLEYLTSHRPDCRVALVLRDILDAPATTAAAWAEQGFESAILRHFDRILILGDRNVFDAAREYRFSRGVRRLVTYCGYARRARPDAADVRHLRDRLLGDAAQLVVVTPGGGEDGFKLVNAYLDAAHRLPGIANLIVCGPEMPAAAREAIQARAASLPLTTVLEFSGEMLTYLAAADVVVSMAGYNTACEVISLRKRAVVVPRAHPVQEQLIRAERFHRLGVLRMVHPDALTPESLAAAVRLEMAQSHWPTSFSASLDGLGTIARWVRSCSPAPARCEPIEEVLAWQPA